jgi:hypothetical protein
MGLGNNFREIAELRRFDRVLCRLGIFCASVLSRERTLYSDGTLR